MGVITAGDFIAAGIRLPLIIAGGPTASGKTDLTIRLSEFVDIEIISADSRQVYKYLDIGTAKPTKEEMAKVPHHLVDFLELTDYYSAGLFGRQAAEIAKDILRRGKLPVVAGGSGLYIQALTEGFFEDDAEGDERRNIIRTELDTRLESEGREALYNELSAVDPESAARYDDKNPRRIVRALEYYYLKGRKFSEAQKSARASENFDIIPFVIELDRELLYSRINARSEKMWKGGIIDETRKALDAGYSTELNSLNTVGYKEAAAFLRGQLGCDEALERLKMNTRRYAKRQVTWLKKYLPGMRLDPVQEENIAAIKNKLGEILAGAKSRMP